MINNKSIVKQLSHLDIHDMNISLEHINLLCTKLANETEMLNSHVEYINKHNPSVYFEDIFNEGLYLSDMLKDLNYYYDNLLKYYTKIW